MVDKLFWSTPAIASKTGETLKLLNYLSLGIFLFDFLLNARFDWSIISGKRQRRWPQLLYFGTKFIFIVYLALSTMLFWLEDQINCQSFVIAAEWAMGSTVIMSSALLACRTVCVFFSRDRVLVVITLLIFGSGLVAAWMQGVQDVTAIWSVAAASPWNSGACLPTAIKSTYYIKYVITIIFDLLVLCLTTIGILRMASTSRIGDVLIKHGLIYFIMTLLVNLFITVLTILHLSPIMSLIAATPQTLICVIASTLLYRNLVEEATTMHSHIASDQFTSPFRSLRRGGMQDKDAIPTSSSNQFSSINSDDRVEKGITSGDRRQSIHVQQEKMVDSSTVLESIRSHPFNNTLPYFNDASSLSHEDRAVYDVYPQLFKRGRVMIGGDVETEGDAAVH